VGDIIASERAVQSQSLKILQVKSISEQFKRDFKMGLLCETRKRNREYLSKVQFGNFIEFIEKADF
jgi:hypothetical protein